MAGETVRIDGLAESLSQIAEAGPSVFYTGPIGAALLRAMDDDGGRVTTQDLAEYRAIERVPIVVDVGEWQVATNPAPAVGGATLAAMLMLLEEQGFTMWDDAGAGRLAEVQQAVLRYRDEVLDVATDRAAAVKALLDAAAVGDYRSLLASPSTVHVSAVDGSGLGCAITTSAGYGSGLMVPGTGLWLNNSLGEIELLAGDPADLPVGSRMISNMAPTVARRRDGAVLSVGSPGASRITTAIAQVLVNFIHLGMSLSDAVAHPRLHVEVFEGEPTIAHEPGVRVTDRLGLRPRRFPDLSMYFGGVGAAMWDPSGGLFVAADPRRSGAVATGGR